MSLGEPRYFVVGTALDTVEYYATILCSVMMGSLKEVTMKQVEFDGLRRGDKICKRSRPNETLSVVINDAGSVIAVRGEKIFDATRLINPENWGFVDSPGHCLTEEEFDTLKVGDRVRYPYGLDRQTFTVVLLDRGRVVAVKGTETVETLQFRNPGNVIRC